MIVNFIRNSRTRFYLYLSKFTSQKIYWNIVGKISPLDAILDNYFDQKEFFKTGKKEVDFFKKLRLFNSKSVSLHIGCGIGRIEKHLSRFIKECNGVDISETMINQAIKLVNEKNCHFYATDGKSLPFENNSIDFVYSILVFQHMAKSMFVKNLNEVKRVLKRGGKFFFQIPLDEKGIKEKPLEKNPWLMMYYHRTEVFQMLEKQGFQVKRTFDRFDKDVRGDLVPGFSILAIKK